MHRGILIRICLLILSGVMIFSLFGCDGDEIGETDSGGAAMVMPVDDVLEVFSWVTRFTDEIDIEDPYRQYLEDEKGIRFQGNLFGQHVSDGKITCVTDYDLGLVEIFSVFCTCGGLSFDDAVNAFTEVYGEPYAMGEEGYAEVNGGAVTWRRFAVGDNTLKISKPSEWDYFIIDVTPGQFE